MICNDTIQSMSSSNVSRSLVTSKLSPGKVFRPGRLKGLGETLKKKQTSRSSVVTLSVRVGDYLGV